MAIPDAKYLGLRSIDYERCDLAEDVKIEINEGDMSRAKQIANYEWFRDKKEWQKEIGLLLKNGFRWKWNR